MSNSKFEDFLNRQNNQAQSATMDWDEQLHEWKKNLELFYNIIESFLKSYIDENKIKLTYRTKKIEEEDIGEYEVREALITLGSNYIKLVPIGTNLIGAKGRVDLIGPNGRIKFVFVNRTATTPKITVQAGLQSEEPFTGEKHPEETEWEWKIATAPPQINYFPLTKDSFFDSLMEVSND